MDSLEIVCQGVGNAVLQILKSAWIVILDTTCLKANAILRRVRTSVMAYTIQQAIQWPLVKNAISLASHVVVLDQISVLLVALTTYVDLFLIEYLILAPVHVHKV